MDYQALKDEITNDPQAIGYAGKSNAELVDLLNDLNFTKKVPVPVNKILIWAAQTGAIVRISDSAANSQTPEAVRAVCMGSLRVIDGAFSETVHFQNPDVMAMLDGLVAGTIITAAEKGALLSLEDAPAGRAEVLFGVPVTIDDVRKAVALP